MIEFKKYTEYFMTVMIIFLMCLIISSPTVCALGAKKGLTVCARVLIPALFPFAVPVLFLINTRLFSKVKNRTLLILLLSLIGGYPIGAKLISELYKRDNISLFSAQKLLPFCVNAGPAFIVIAVGKGILNDIKLGFVLLLAHVTASIISVLVFLPRNIFKEKSNNTDKTISSADNFVLSIKGASDATILICAFVVFFSVTNEYIIHFAPVFTLLTEVTYAVSRTNNVYLISFLLGFAGISIWLQIFAMCDGIKPKLAVFIAVRILHGALSAAITVIVLKALKISIYTISNSIIASSQPVYSNYALSLSLIIMAILLLINFTSKKHSGNIFKDMI